MSSKLSVILPTISSISSVPAAFSAAYRVYSNVFYNVYTKFYVLQTDNAPNGHAHTPTKPGTPRTNNRSLPASGNTNGPSSRPLFFLFQSGTYPSTNFRYCFSTSCKSFKGHFDRLSKNETVTVNPSFFFTLLQLPIICPPYKITG